MGLWEFLRQWPRGRLFTGVMASLLVHVLLALGVLWALKSELKTKDVAKRGDTLIVELPKPEEPANAGSPNAASPTPPAPVRPPSPPMSRPSPPPREAPAAPREERRLASAPRPAPSPAPRAPEPAPRLEPAPGAPEPAPRAAEPDPSTPASVAPGPRAVEPAPRAPATVERREGADRQVASLPPARPSGPPSQSDVRAALRAGSGGQARGHGGIEGDPIPLDSADERYNDYLEQIRRRIKEKWGFPCVRNPSTRECDHHTTSLDVHFGILKNGQIQYVDVVRASDYDIYDEYAVNAIRLAQPFPPVPPAMMAAMRQGSTGLAISARFSYVVESSLTNLLR
jgi:TonB family protein